MGFPISTDNASWRGPNIEKLAPPNFYRQWELGLDDEINFAKISFLSHLTQNKFHYPQNKQLTI
ncbi:hypothetical protein DWR07_08945 [Staphylococcus aureus]|nr:hypothetical protein DWR07_08945 [Staphylococcus aureus]